MTVQGRGRLGARSFVLVSLALMSWPGCDGSKTAGGQYAPTVDRARELVRTALDAWKRGAAAELARGSPPLRFVEPELGRNTSLAGYTILEGQEQTVGPVVDVPVELTIRDRKKTSRTVRTFYQVATEPNLAVVRNDPD